MIFDMKGAVSFKVAVLQKHPPEVVEKVANGLLKAEDVPLAPVDYTIDFSIKRLSPWLLDYLVSCNADASGRIDPTQGMGSTSSFVMDLCLFGVVGWETPLPASVALIPGVPTVPQFEPFRVGTKTVERIPPDAWPFLNPQVFFQVGMEIRRISSLQVDQKKSSTPQFSAEPSEPQD